VLKACVYSTCMCLLYVYVSTLRTCVYSKCMCLLYVHVSTHIQGSTPHLCVYCTFYLPILALKICWICEWKHFCTCSLTGAHNWAWELVFRWNNQTSWCLDFLPRVFHADEIEEEDAWIFYWQYEKRTSLPPLRSLEELCITFMCLLCVHVSLYLLYPTYTELPHIYGPTPHILVYPTYMCLPHIYESTPRLWVYCTFYLPILNLNTWWICEWKLSCTCSSQGRTAERGNWFSFGAIKLLGVWIFCLVRFMKIG